MCRLVRGQHAGAAEGGSAPLPPSLERLRPRWAAAAAAVLIGGLAVAALVAPPSKPTLSGVKDGAPVAPLSSRAAQVPTAGFVEQTALPMVDDGVPGTSDVAKARAGNCEHGL